MKIFKRLILSYSGISAIFIKIIGLLLARLTMLDAIYVDARKTKSIIAIKPKPPFKPVFQVAASKKDSNIRILNEPLEGSSLFLVETGESRTPRPEEAVQDMLQV